MNLKGCAPQPFWLTLEDAKAAHADGDYCPFCRMSDFEDDELCTHCWLAMVLGNGDAKAYKESHCDEIGADILVALNGEDPE